MRKMLLVLITACVQCVATGRPRQVHWQVDAGRAKEGVSQWAAAAKDRGAITGLTGCCGRFSVLSNGTFVDNFPEEKYPLGDWDFVHELGLTMHFVFTVEQSAFITGNAMLAIPAAVGVALASNFTGYALDYETPPSGPPSSQIFARESEGVLRFAAAFATALHKHGKELIIDVGGTTAASLSTQAPYQQNLTRRWGKSGVDSLMTMGTYFGTDLGFNEVLLASAMKFGVPVQMLNVGIGSTTSAGCGCGTGGHGNRSCCAPHACCGPASSSWARNPPFSPTPACVGQPCANCKTLGTTLPCYNWTDVSLRSFANTLVRRGISKVSVFMSTLDKVEDPATEGRNATSAFFYDVMRAFLQGHIPPWPSKARVHW